MEQERKNGSRLFPVSPVILLLHFNPPCPFSSHLPKNSNGVFRHIRRSHKLSSVGHEEVYVEEKLRIIGGKASLWLHGYLLRLKHQFVVQSEESPFCFFLRSMQLQSCSIWSVDLKYPVKTALVQSNLIQPALCRWKQEPIRCQCKMWGCLIMYSPNSLPRKINIYFSDYHLFREWGEQGV